MIVLGDNDVLRKLARCDLFTEFLQAFGVSFSAIFILNTTHHALQSNRVRKQLGEDSFHRLKAVLGAVQIIQSVPDPNELISLTEQPNLDTEEAILFSVAHQQSDTLLATGDKRSLQALTKACRCGLPAPLHAAHEQDYLFRADP